MKMHRLDSTVEEIDKEQLEDCLNNYSFPYALRNDGDYEEVPEFETFQDSIDWCEENAHRLQRQSCGVSRKTGKPMTVLIKNVQILEFHQEG